MAFLPISEVESKESIIKVDWKSGRGEEIE